MQRSGLYGDSPLRLYSEYDKMNQQGGPGGYFK